MGAGSVRFGLDGVILRPQGVRDHSDGTGLLWTL